MVEGQAPLCRNGGVSIHKCVDPLSLKRAAINDNHVLTVKGGDFRVKFWTSFLWVPMIAIFHFFLQCLKLLNYHILKYGVPIKISCRTNVFIGCGNILSLYVKYGTVSLGLRFTIIFFWNCITQKQSHIETPYRQWRHSVVMTWRQQGIPLSAQLSSQWQAAIISSAANDCRELAARSYTLREAGSCHSTFD